MAFTIRTVIPFIPMLALEAGCDLSSPVIWARDLLRIVGTVLRAALTVVLLFLLVRMFAGGVRRRSGVVLQTVVAGSAR